VFADLGLSSKQFCALEFIARNPTVSQTELAQHIGTTSVTMVKLLDDLTRRGLLTRTTDPANRRRHKISLTPAGRALLPKLKQRALEVEQRVAQRHGLTQLDQTQLLRLLRKIADAPQATE
jgi:DNA-binding MarR family transcriptional regulator